MNTPDRSNCGQDRRSCIRYAALGMVLSIIYVIWCTCTDLVVDRIVLPLGLCCKTNGGYIDLHVSSVLGIAGNCFGPLLAFVSLLAGFALSGLVLRIRVTNLGWARQMVIILLWLLKLPAPNEF